MKKIVLFLILIFFLIISNTIFIFADEFDDEFSFDEQIVEDPIESYNRAVTSVNDKIYLCVLAPSSEVYSEALPEGARMSFYKFFYNLMFPIRFVNNILQLKFERAGVETARFIVNSTIGMAGLLDPAEDIFKLKSYDEDFGQTLGFYKMGSIFHIDWPFLGPSNLRDTIGYVADLFLNPINYIPNMWIVAAVHVFEKVNETSLHLGEYEKLRQESVDYYLQIRDSYEQYRKKEIEE